MNFDKLFYPKSIAIIGASRREKTVGNDIVKNLVQQKYKGKIYPVNPKADKLYGKKVYHDLNEIKGKIDLSVVAIPAAFVQEAVEKSHKKGVEAVVVISAGFKETGEEKLEEKLKQFCLDKNIALLGPNCLGIINPEIKMNASFATIMPETGQIAFVSQSGALCATVLDYAKKLKLGFSKFLSTGNKTIIDEIALLEYFAEDKKTKIITLYAEQLTNAPKIIKTVKKVTSGKNPKPVIILKSGKTEAGAKAVVSHTGSIGGGDKAYDALFEQAGMIRANSINELFDLAAIFAENKIQNIKNVAIITNAGGPGVLTTDSIVAAGLKLANLSQITQTKLKKFLPPAASIKNPIDILGDATAERYKKTLETIVADKKVDSLIVILTPQSMTEVEATAQTIVKLKQKTKKPIVVSFMGQDTVESGVEIMEEGGLTTTSFPEAAGTTLAALGQFDKTKKKPSPYKTSKGNKNLVTKIFAQAKTKKQIAFSEVQTLPILAAYGLPILQNEQANNAENAKKIAKKLGGKLVMKIISPDILHKSDVGGVMLNITAENATKKYKEIISNIKKNKPRAKIDGVLLMKMAAQDGIEMILGVNKIANLGTVIMLGMGGIYVETIKDIQMAFVPLTSNDINRMINKLKMHEVLKGARGQKSYDIKTLKKAIKNLNQLVLDFPEIVELDINPLMIFPESRGVKVLDGRIVIR